MDARDRTTQHVVVDGDPIPKTAGGHNRHCWMMLAFIAPLSLVAAALILTGASESVAPCSPWDAWR